MELNIQKYIKKQQLRGKTFKQYQCQYCQVTFDKPSAYGGHIAKNHKKSKD